MKLTIFTSLAIIILYFTYYEKDNSEIYSDTDTEKFNLKCPAPPLFTETIKSGSTNKDVQAGNEDIDQSWYQSAMEYIEKEEYNISYNEDLKSYQSTNRANNIRFIYKKDGFTAKTRSNRIPLFDVNDITIPERDKKYEMIDDWSIEFKIKNEEYIINSSELKAAGNKASIENENIRIDYTNDKKGMRQDFIIKKKPESEGKLRLKINVDTKLKMIVGADALMFKDNKGIEKMKYSALKVWDANGKKLDAFFEKNENKIKSIGKSRNNKFKSFDVVVNIESAIYPITIDPISTTPNWSVQDISFPQGDNMYFGQSVSTAGDVNGDGFSDVIISRGWSYTIHFPNEPLKVYGYYGSESGLSIYPDWIVSGECLECGFGGEISTAGDVNGDGYSDVIINGFNANTTGHGSLYYGSENGLSTTANWVGTGYGFYSTAGDVNGDGYSDIICFKHYYDSSAYVFHGSSSGLSITPNWIVNDQEFFYSACTAGDVNGDGFSDVILGNHFYSNGQINEGRAYVYHGSASGLSNIPNWTAESNHENARFGYVVSTAGDVNGDGYSDVIIGAPNYTNGELNEGIVFIYFGSTNGLSETLNWSKESNSGGSYFGSTVSTAGDVNGDGFSDVLINGDSTFAFYGSSVGLSEKADWLYTYSSDVSTAGDINGDGFSDVLISNRFARYIGEAYEFHGSASGLSNNSNLVIENNQADSKFGISISTAGDVNGDGYSDVIIGAQFFDNGEADEGRTFVYHGSETGLSATANWTVESDQSGSGFGGSVSTAGDVNGDGFSDVIVGARFFDNGQTDEGKVFVYLGSSTGLSLISNWSSESNQSNADYGGSVSTAGDVNGDGYSDVIVGSRYFDNGQFNEGKVFVFYGSQLGLSSTANWTADNNQDHSYFGNKVSTAGDVNGDGFDEVIIGSPFYDNGQLNEGRVYVYHGSTVGLSGNPNWTTESNQANAYLGINLSTAGDVNGDGYSDIIIGAQFYDNGQIDEGKAFVYQGSSSGLSISSNWEAESDQAASLFGSVSTAGDVNGDGYSDIIVGAQNYDNGETDEGRAYVYQGSPTGLSDTANWVVESDQAASGFGYVVSTAGDVNGDGYSDVIVGAPFFDNGETDEGRAFIYYGNNGGGIRSTVQQYKPGTNDVVASGGFSGTNGQVRLNIFGKSPLGRADGRIVYEYKISGEPFSGSTITNSTSFSGTGSFIDLGTNLSGVHLNKDISGLIPDKNYKWRARVQYSLVNNPYQKFGPWKYYNSYTPVPIGNFRANDGPTVSQLDLTMFIQGFYYAPVNVMVEDTAFISLRNNFTPYTVVDNSKAFLSPTGQALFLFANVSNNVGYYIQMKHRNSIETWSKSPQQFNSSLMTFDFSTSKTQAYGDNMIQIDSSPLRFGIYSGDVNQDGTIDIKDEGLISNDAVNYVTGYIPTDLNGDGIVDVADAIFADNNGYNFVGKVTP